MDYSKSGDLGFQAIEGEEFSIEALVEEFSKMSKDEIYSEGTKCSSDILDFLMEKVENPAEDYTNIMLTCARAACFADGIIDAEERALTMHLLDPIREVMGADVEALVDEPASEDRLRAIRERCEAFADLGDAGRQFAESLARLMMCFVAVDGRIDSSEFNMIEKLFKEVYDKLGTYKLFEAMGISL